jgi:hypothetical protein
LIVGFPYSIFKACSACIEYKCASKSAHHHLLKCIWRNWGVLIRFVLSKCMSILWCLLTICKMMLILGKRCFTLEAFWKKFWLKLSFCFRNDKVIEERRFY